MWLTFHCVVTALFIDQSITKAKRTFPVFLRNIEERLCHIFPHITIIIPGEKEIPIEAFDLITFCCTLQSSADQNKPKYLEIAYFSKFVGCQSVIKQRYWVFIWASKWIVQSWKCLNFFFFFFLSLLSSNTSYYVLYHRNSSFQWFVAVLASHGSHKRG